MVFLPDKFSHTLVFDHSTPYIFVGLAHLDYVLSLPVRYKKRNLKSDVQSF